METNKNEVAKHNASVAIVDNSPSALLSMAIEKGVGIEALQKLMDMQIAWEKKEAAKSFKLAMAEFQAKKPLLVKTSKVIFDSKKTNSTTAYSFLPLPVMQSKIDPVASEFGITYRWEQIHHNNVIEVTCIVSHVDGHEEKTTLQAPSDTSGNKNAIQSIGSTVSYLKRYTLECALGLSSVNDDDGNSSKTPTVNKKIKMNEAQVKKTMKAINAGEVENIDKISEYFILTEDQFNVFKTLFNSKTTV